MRCRLAVLAVVLAVGGLAACSRDKDDRPTPQAQPGVGAASTVPLPGASGSAALGSGTKPTAPGPGVSASGLGHGKVLPSGTQLTAAGVGPYVIGVEQAELASSGLVGAVSTGSDGCDSGTGLSRYGTPALLFTKGKLQHVKITGTTIKTPAGVGVGTALAAVKRAYPGGRELTGPAGAAWYAESGDFALLLRIGGGKVSAIEAGPAATLPFTFTGNQGC
jgi:hypothetical protein